MKNRNRFLIVTGTFVRCWFYSWSEQRKNDASNKQQKHVLSLAHESLPANLSSLRNMFFCRFLRIQVSERQHLSTPRTSALRAKPRSWYAKLKSQHRLTRNKKESLRAQCSNKKFNIMRARWLPDCGVNIWIEFNKLPHRMQPTALVSFLTKL